MTKLWILLAVSLVLAWFIEYRDRSLLARNRHHREHLLTMFLTVILCFFSGLRTWGNDTGTYMEIYVYLTPTIEELPHAVKPEFSSGIGFYYVSVLLKTWGFSTQNYLLFFSVLSVIPYVWFVRKYSPSLTFGVFLMFTTGFYSFTLAAIKQCMATGICLLATSCAIDRKWLRYAFLLVLASLFHPYAVVYLLLPLLMFKPWTSRTFIYIGIFVAAGFYLESLLGTVLDITDMMGASYDEESFTGEGVNIFRVAVAFVPLILGVFYGKNLFRNATRAECLMYNMAMLNALIMFVGLFGTANYFARLANYFLPAQVIILPWILRKVHHYDRAWLKPACIVGYLGYFIYENAIIRPFDYTYSHMSFWEYIGSLF